VEGNAPLGKTAEVKNEAFPENQGKGADLQKDSRKRTQPA